MYLVQLRMNTQGQSMKIPKIKLKKKKRHENTKDQIFAQSQLGN